MKNYEIKNSIKKIYFLILFFSFPVFAQQITGLSGWNIYLDPGHSENENMGIYNYSEARKVLRVGLNLRQMLLDYTDIDTVYICRTNDQQQVSLTQRTDQANALGAAHYHSIHSDASGTASTNSTLLMWGQLGIGGPEKSPKGGKKMADIMVGLLTSAYRTNTRGSVGDRTFYGVDGTKPYLHVNRETNMASELSEAGFHTNPTQNQLNMNANWKRVEAITMFWTILKYHNVARPYVGTSIGIVKDSESGLAVNGAIVTLNGLIDTTDTYQSLFKQYSIDPNQLRNGFYYFENVPAGTHQLQVTAAGFDPYTTSITMADTFFTFKDVNLISNKPPVVSSTVPANSDSVYPGIGTIVINFSRPMDKPSVESNLIIEPSEVAAKTWSNSDKTLTLATTNLAFSSQYQITIQGTAFDKYNHLFDGNGDGVGGDPYSFIIKTSAPDTKAPVVVDVFPQTNAVNVDLKPVINISFDEKIKTSTVSSRVNIIRNSDQSKAPFITKHTYVGNRSVLNYFVSDTLAFNETYTIKILPGLEDLFGNATQTEYSSEFTVGYSIFSPALTIDNFDSGIASWWLPGASGSTIGTIAEQTSASSNSTIFISGGSTKSMQVNYGWDVSASNWLIREYRSVASPSFNNSTIIQVYLFGDGNKNKFRFALKETATTTFEVSPWIDVDWIGWKVVNWDLSQGQTGNWIGNNVLEPPFTFDSFQMTYANGNNTTGAYYFDDLRTAALNPVSVEKENDVLPDNFILEQNYPNPFNPSTNIRYSIPVETHRDASLQMVTLKVYDILGKEVAILVNEEQSAGNYVVNFDASKLSSGVYFYTLTTDNFKQTKKMILMK